MSGTSTARPAAWKNTYFWLAGILLVLAIIGLPFFGGDQAIRDPGQKRESSLWILYAVGSLVAYINGRLSHRYTVEAHDAELNGDN